MYGGAGQVSHTGKRGTLIEDQYWPSYLKSIYDHKVTLDWLNFACGCLLYNLVHKRSNYLVFGLSHAPPCYVHRVQSVLSQTWFHVNRELHKSFDITLLVYIKTYGSA